MSSEVCRIVWLEIRDEEVIDISGVLLCMCDRFIDTVDRVYDDLMIDECFDSDDHQDDIDEQ